ncbi:MAG: DUF4340 domain-containing protein [Oscillospiraceae bacterium]|nr:DUF4340 domain-containing protein [Oscillospiraceae bacterium]
MKKNIKLILFSLIGLAVLGTAVLILHLTQSEEITEQPQPPETNQTATIFSDFTEEEVVSVYIVNPKDDGYTISANPHGIVEIDERDAAEVPYNRAFLSSTVNSAANLSSFSTVEENAEELDKYGLLNPLVKVEAVFRNGETLAFSVGEPTPDGDTYYFRLEGGNAVYAIETHKVNSFFNERHDYIERLAFPQYNSDEAPTIHRVSIESENADTPIIIEAIPKLDLEELRTFNSHKMTVPLNIDVDPDKSMQVIYGIFGLTASKVLWVAPDEVDFELSGLTQPQCRVEITVGEEIFSLAIGNEYQGGFYGISSHAPDLLFLFDPDSLPWLDLEPINLVSDIFLTPYLYSLDTLEITTENLTVIFTVKGDADDNTILFENNPLSGKDRERFSDLYQFVISVRGEEIYTGDDSSDSKRFAKITYNYRNGTSDQVVFRESNRRRTVIEVNAVPMFTCRDIYTTRLLENIESFISGGEIILDW